jgi:hypothetical protein
MQKIYLTYNNDAHTDGAGAQLYRIFGVYCLAKKFGLGYIHSPLKRIDHQGLEALRTQQPDESLVERFNKLCDISSDIEWPPNATVIDLPDPMHGFHETLITDHNEASGPLIVRITHPHHVIDVDPEIWTAAEDVSPFSSFIPWDGQRPLRVAVHVRRGDVHLLEKSRILPNSYYIRIMRKLMDLFDKLQAEYVLELHSERSVSDFTVSKAGFGVYKSSPELTFHKSDDAFHEFEHIEKLCYRFNEETLQSFCSIASADIIVTSISCFSYLAAILNQKSVVIYHPFFHAPLDRWVVAERDGNFDVAILEDALKHS